MKPFHLKMVPITIGANTDRVWSATHTYSGRSALARTPKEAYEVLVILLRGERHRIAQSYMKLGYARGYERPILGNSFPGQRWMANFLGTQKESS